MLCVGTSDPHIIAESSVQYYIDLELEALIMMAVVVCIRSGCWWDFMLYWP
jgi:hypothetical protein